MGVVANPLCVRIFINSTLTPKGSGWSERLPILENDWDAALGVATQMMLARRNVLCSNCYVQWACLATVEPPYYEQPVIDQPLYPLPQWGPAAFDMQGVNFDLNTTSGENAPRLFRGIEATEINNKQWKYKDMPIPWVPPPLPADLATAPKDLLWQNTLATYRQFMATQQPMEDGHHGPGVGYWVDAFQQIVYREVRSRRWHKHWTRMSWEASNWNHSPGFSPCGCVVTVNSFSYAIPCRFGVGWRLRDIHYYPARAGATVMPFATPFCCWDRSKEWTDFDGVGEARKFRASDWTTGVEYGNAPGIMWDGTEEEFNGFAPVPTWGTGSTPFILRPACDTPVISRPTGAGGIALGGIGYVPPVNPEAFLYVDLRRPVIADAGGDEADQRYAERAPAIYIPPLLYVASRPPVQDLGDETVAHRLYAQPIELPIVTVRTPVVGGSGCAPGLAQPITYGSSSGGGSFSPGWAVPTKPGNILFLAFAGTGTVTGNVVPPAGFTSVNTYSASMISSLNIYTAQPATSYTSVSISLLTGTYTQVDWFAMEFTPCSLHDSVDQIARDNGTSTAASTGTTFATHVAVEIIVGIMSAFVTSSGTISSPVGMQQGISVGASLAGYKITTAVGTQEFSGTVSGSVFWGGIIGGVA